MSDFNISKGVGFLDYVPLIGNAEEKELQNVRALKRSNPSLANYSDKQLLESYRSKDRGILGHLGIRGGHQGQQEAFRSDIEAASFDKGANRRKQKANRLEAIEGQKLLDDYRFGNQKKQLELQHGFNNQLQDRQFGMTKELMGAKFGQQKELTGMQLGGQKDLANIQGQFGLKQTQTAGQLGIQQARTAGEFGLKQADLSGQYGLKTAQLQSDTQRYGVDAKMKDARRQRRFESQQNQLNRRHSRIAGIHQGGRQAAAGRQQMITNILTRR